MKIIQPMTITTANLTASNVAETDYAAWSIATTYALGDRRIYVVGDNHWVVESLQAANVGHTPTGLATDTWWLKISNTNRWKMFDQSVSSQTTNTSSISTTHTTVGRTDSVALLNIDAATARIIVTDSVDGVVYDQTSSLISDSGITDWYAYFFEPIVRITDKVVTDLPKYNNPTIQIILTDTGNTVKCGACILGISQTLGATQYGMTLGVTDYSVKQQDDFGNYSILERAFRRVSEMTLLVNNNFINQLQQKLSLLRATPIVYIGADDYSASIVYGFYKDFSINVAYSSNSICNLSLEGLT